MSFQHNDVDDDDDDSDNSDGVITIGFGPLSNLVGAHIININNHTESPQRTRKLAAKSSSVPRYIAVDVPNNVGRLQEQQVRNDLRTPAWAGRVDVQSAVDDDKSVLQWTDIVECDLHQRNLALLTGLHAADAALLYYTDGVSAMSASSRGEVILDNARWFAEECDRVAAFECIVDADSGWNGVAEWTIQQLHDDYEHVPIVTVALHHGRDDEHTSALPKIKRARELNTAIAYAKLAPISDMYAPLYTTEASLLNSARFMAASFYNASTPYAHCAHSGIDWNVFSHAVVKYSAANIIALSATTQEWTRRVAEPQTSRTPLVIHSLHASPELIPLHPFHNAELRPQAPPQRDESDDDDDSADGKDDDEENKDDVVAEWIVTRGLSIEQRRWIDLYCGVVRNFNDADAIAFATHLDVIDPIRLSADTMLRILITSSAACYYVGRELTRLHDMWRRAPSEWPQNVSAMRNGSDMSSVEWEEIADTLKNIMENHRST